MTLSFPNESRSLESSKSRIRFWGYDSAMEITFFVEAGALMKLCPRLSAVEGDFLEAFDSAVTRIHEVAAKAYSRGRKGSYTFVLAAADF